MVTEEDQIRLKEKLQNEKPNSFEWSKYRKKNHKAMWQQIMKNPYECDTCGDTYNKDDLYSHDEGYHCQNCLLWI